MVLQLLLPPLGPLVVQPPKTIHRVVHIGDATQWGCNTMGHNGDATQYIQNIGNHITLSCQIGTQGIRWETVSLYIGRISTQANFLDHLF